MCHLILLMPVLGLPIFWLMPLNLAVPIYVVIVLMSAFFYWLITRAMRKPIQDGFQSLIGTEAEVVSKQASGKPARYIIRSQGELWSAYSTDNLQLGEQVNIVAVRGIGVVIERAENRSHPEETGHAKTVLSGVKNN